MMKIIKIILISIIICSCNQTFDKKNKGKYYSAQVFTEKNATFLTKLKTNQTPELDVLKFVKLSNSLLTQIQGKPIKLTYKIDAIKAKNTSKISFYHPLFISSSNSIKRYSFNPGKDNNALQIWLLEAKYKDSISTNKVFKELHFQSGRIQSKIDHYPGLTYTNDYVIRSNNKIYWLNSGCAISFSNHQKLKKIMLQSLQIDKIQDSIWCKCGQPECSL
ncbi:MAG: hypothetical protein QM535_07975 [Limnohabitans sp.]|nr:hypothetical protein [Limnohabitans sp.]